MNRELILKSLKNKTHWDLIIIGGGATGLGTAVDASSRGFKTLLLEQEDFAKGTSSRSTKLLHGGVRYLAQGNIKMVMVALKERGLLLKNAPHVSSTFSLIIPVYTNWQKLYYGIGLKIYDLMAGSLRLGSTYIISKEKTIQQLPGIKEDKLKGGIVFNDGQFDDTRLAINLAQTAEENGASILNYCKVTALQKENNKISGIIFKDLFTQREYEVKCTALINATGVFTDAVQLLDDPSKPPMVSPSQGVHIVLDKKSFPGEDALMIPKTSDGRVLFALPWYNKVIVGTTDTAIKNISLEPTALKDEIQFILNNINVYLKSSITKTDVLSVFAGLRPLVKIKGIRKTSLMPRDHTIIISKTGLISITGGKWTTYRKMAKDVVDKTILSSNLLKKECCTQDLKIHGWADALNKTDPLHFYGSDLELLKKLYVEDETWNELIHPLFPYTKACVIWAVRNEMAITVEDVLARRTRILFLDANAAIEAAPLVAALMAKEMKKEVDWIDEQTNLFITLAKQYLL